MGCELVKSDFVKRKQNVLILIEQKKKKKVNHEMKYW